jgi:peptide-methionine (S)-S-oxide reductase
MRQTLTALLTAALLAALAPGGRAQGRTGKAMSKTGGGAGAGRQTAILGGGCFWCLEAVYERFVGVKSVVSGYAGGSTPDPTYEQVCTGTTGHAEVVEIEFDPAVIGYERILEIFWKAHDPSSLNRQGADVGTQYRSIILYRDEAQRVAAEKSREQAAKQFERPIVTEIASLKAFYRAEDYHQDYYAKNPFAGYCTFVIRPKLQKLGLN